MAHDQASARRWAELAELFDGPADPAWAADRQQIPDDVQDPWQRAAQANQRCSGEPLTERESSAAVAAVGTVREKRAAARMLPTALCCNRIVLFGRRVLRPDRVGCYRRRARPSAPAQPKLMRAQLPMSGASADRSRSEGIACYAE